MKNLFLIAIIVLGFSVSSNAIEPVATASTTATLVAPLTIAKTTDMNFGTVAGSNALSSIVLGYTSNLTPSAGAYVIGGTATSAVFTVTGSLAESISVSIPALPISLTGTTTGMTVSDFVADCGTTTTLVSGTKVITIGAKLNIPANAAAGTYSNAVGLSVTVNYN